jgi:hypothetical protein
VGDGDVKEKRGKCRENGKYVHPKRAKRYKRTIKSAVLQKG